MKFLFLIFLFVGYSTCQIFSERTERLVSHDQMQRNFYKLLSHVHQPNTYHDQVQIGKSWDFMKHLDMYENPQAVKEFYKMFMDGMLPRGKIFSVHYDRQRYEAISLFHLFYYAKDIDTFYKTACWARDNVNEGMFVYSLSVAMLHRPDTKSYHLPAPYEIYPHFFVNTEVIEKAKRIKMQEGILDPELDGEFYGIHQDRNSFIILSNYSGWYVTHNKEQKLSYFTEDVGLNSYYFYFHAKYPFWMSAKQFLVEENRGEKFLWFHQQLLARYYMERLSVGLGEIPFFSWHNPIETGFVSSLKHPNGIPFPNRPNFYEVRKNKNVFMLNDVEDYERHIRDAVLRGFLVVDKNTFIDLRNPEDIEVLGNMIQGNVDAPNSRFYKFMILIAKTLLGNSITPHNGYNTVPSVLEQYTTALRDPMFYQMYKRFMFYALRFKSFLHPYTHEELVAPGVKIEDVEVTKLETFFNETDIDITNTLHRSKSEINDDEKYSFYARQLRLDHHPFDVKFLITSDTKKDVVIKTFLGPKYDSMGHHIPINKNRVNFYELDEFKITLVSGKNHLTRPSTQFSRTSSPTTPVHEFLTHKTYRPRNVPLHTDVHSDHHYLPENLLLPRGKKGGMPFQFFFMVISCPSKTHTSRTVEVTGSDEIESIEDFMKQYAMGYPLDRPIYKFSEFYTPNMFFKDVVITHKYNVTSGFYIDHQMEGMHHYHRHTETHTEY